MKENIEKITIELRGEDVTIIVFKVSKGGIVYLDEDYFRNKQKHYTDFVKENEILNMEVRNCYFIKYKNMMVCIDSIFISEMTLKDDGDVSINSQIKMTLDPEVLANKWFNDESRKNDIEIMIEVICALGQLTVPVGGVGEIVAPTTDEILGSDTDKIIH